MLRLHENGFVQQSVSDRNLLVQPGPLTVAPEKRSLKTPSFRLIDFGRGMVRGDEDFETAVDKDRTSLRRLLKFEGMELY